MDEKLILKLQEKELIEKIKQIRNADISLSDIVKNAILEFELQTA